LAKGRSELGANLNAKRNDGYGALYRVAPPAKIKTGGRKLLSKMMDSPMMRKSYATGVLWYISLFVISLISLKMSDQCTIRIAVTAFGLCRGKGHDYDSSQPYLSQQWNGASEAEVPYRENTTKPVKAVESTQTTFSNPARPARRGWLSKNPILGRVIKIKQVTIDSMVHGLSDGKS
ncbi:hypothetical protein Tco_0633603, partial [Tanacetum coccineum]